MTRFNSILTTTLKTTTLTLSLIASIATINTVQAAPASTAQATNGLVKQLQGIQRLSANFEQTTRPTVAPTVQKKGLTAQHMNQTFKGEMKVERPGKFFWQTSTPSKQTIVTSGKTVWVYDPDLQQAVRQTLDEQVANTPALLLSGNTQLIMQAYRITQPDSKKLSFTLYPKLKDGAFQSLSISFAANKAPSSMVLQDSLGQTTTVKFLNSVVNGTIPASVFNFTPPKGTDIIEQ